VRQSFAGFSNPELNGLSKAKSFAHWIGRSESLLRNVENRIVPLSANLARRISERTGVDASWLLSDPPEQSPIPSRDGGSWDPLRLLDPLVLGDHDFRNALPMVPELLLQLALEIIQAACLRALQQGDTTLLVQLMELIKRHIDLSEESFLTALTAKLQQPEHADAYQLWVVSHLAAKHRSTAQAQGIPPSNQGE
jgi:hypothetical protein